MTNSFSVESFFPSETESKVPDSETSVELDPRRRPDDSDVVVPVLFRKHFFPFPDEDFLAILDRKRASLSSRSDGSDISWKTMEVRRLVSNCSLLQALP
jgi:hypothetical protein